MFLEKYGIRLRRITENDIELIRQKRNDPAIVSTMIYQKPISAEEQLKWFNSIDNERFGYYLVEINNHAIGMINDKNINWEKKETESGMFIWDTAYLGTIYPSMASLMMMEVGFELYDWNRLLITIRSDNQKAIQYNKLLGFKLAPDQAEASVQKQYFLDAATYGKKIRAKIISLTKLTPHQTLYLELGHPSDNTTFLEKYRDIIQVVKTKFHDYHEEGSLIKISFDILAAI